MTSKSSNYSDSYLGIIFSFGIIAIIIGAFYGVALHKVIKVDNEYWYTAIADEPLEWSKGLGEVNSICDACAMLFDFKDATDTERIFWMKGMRFDLDIYWLDQDYNVLYVQRGLSPTTYYDNNPPLTYGHGVNARYVFETNPKQK